MRFLHSLWLIDCAAHLVILSLKGRLFLLPHSVNHLQRFAQLAQSLRCIWKSIAIRSIFLLIPARTDTKVQATMAQHIKGAGHLRHQGRIAIAIAGHNLPHTDAFRIACQSRQRHPALKCHLLRGVGNRMKVINQPDCLKTCLIGGLSHICHRLISFNRIFNPYQTHRPAIW